ncbi:MAG: preprotein translocase subunit SecE, partial [Asticcacaulis sp.]
MKQPQAPKGQASKSKAVTPLRKPAASGTAIGKIEPVKAAAATADARPKKPFNPVKFFAEVRQEARRITWTSRKEIWITTVMVLIMVVAASVFLWAVDAVFGYLLSLLQT